MAFVIDSRGKVFEGSFCEYMQARLDALTDDAPAPSGKRAVAAARFEAQHGRRPVVVKVEAPELEARREVRTAPGGIVNRYGPTSRTARAGCRRAWANGVQYAYRYYESPEPEAPAVGVDPLAERIAATAARQGVAHETARAFEAGQIVRLQGPHARYGRYARVEGVFTYDERQGPVYDVRRMDEDENTGELTGSTVMIYMVPGFDLAAR